MGKRLFLWLVLILAGSLVLAIACWLADELGFGGGIGSATLPDTLLTLALIAMLVCAVLLAILAPGVFRSRLTPPDGTIKRR
jgi:hypothetical protein